MMESSRELVPGSKRTVDRVLQDNSYWAHPENILIAMLGDNREVIRNDDRRTDFKIYTDTLMSDVVIVL